MGKFSILEATTKDGLVHQGMYFEPAKKEKRALLWVHGLTDNFYGDMGMVEAFVDTLGKEGWGIASFNTRGHDVVTSVKKLDPSKPKGYTSLNMGAGYEVFADCVHDIDAGISFLAKEGFSEVVIAGSSTGANKVCYYAGTKKDPRVVGVILVSPISDVPIESKTEHYRANLERVKKLIQEGRGEVLLDDVSYLALTPNRYVSLYEPGSVEDVFDYYNEKPKLTIFSQINTPLAVVMAGSDEYSDRPVSEILEVFKKYQKSTKYQGVVVQDAFHSLSGKEKEAIQTVIEWIKSI